MINFIENYQSLNVACYLFSHYSFNYCLSKTRVHVECVFGQMKWKFNCLKSTLQYQPDAVVNIIKACAFLWNWGLITGDNFGYHPDKYVVDDEDAFDAKLQATYSGRLRRDAIRDYLWAHK